MAGLEEVVVLPSTSASEPLINEERSCSTCGTSDDTISTLDWFKITFSSVASRGEAITFHEWEAALQVPVCL